MKGGFKLLVFLSLVGFIMLLSSCGGTGGAFNEYSEEITNSEGEVTLIVGGTEVKVTVSDDKGNPLENIRVMGYDLGNGKILLIAEDPNEDYFRDYKLISKSFSESYSKSSQLIDIEKFPVVTVSFMLKAAVEVGAIVYHYISDPSEFPLQVLETLDESNKVVKKLWIQVDVDDLLNLIGLAKDANTIRKGIVVFGSPARLRGVKAIKFGFLRKKLFEGVEEDLEEFVARTAIESVIGQLSDRDIINIATFKLGEREIPIAKVEVEYGENAEIADYRFILMWLEQPEDLDAHMKVFSNDSLIYHVYYGDKGSKEYYPYVQLDVDDINSYGPENIFVWYLMNDLDYVFFVHNYSGERRLKNCGAIVKVFYGRELIDFVRINDALLSSSEGRYWYVGFIKNGIWYKTNQVISYEPSTPWQ